MLVTGATGFVGAHVVDQLLKNGYFVRATARSQQKADHIISLYVINHYSLYIYYSFMFIYFFFVYLFVSFMKVPAIQGKFGVCYCS